MFLDRDGQSEAEHLARVKLADSLMFTTRGNPVTYYGDEQGFVSTGGDQAAREDMFASQVELYNTEKVLAGPEGSLDRYNTEHPLYQHIPSLSALRAEHPALADGAQVNRYAADGAGIFAVSRIGAGTKGGSNTGRVEYVVAANNSTQSQQATFRTWTTTGRSSAPVYGTDQASRPTADGAVTVTVPPLSLSVWRANKPISTTGAAPTVETVLAEGGAHGRTEVARRRHGEHLRPDLVHVAPGRRQRVAAPSAPTTTRRSGSSTTCPASRWRTPLEYRAVVKDAAGRVAGDSHDHRRWSSGRPRPFPSSATRRPSQPGHGARSPAR